MIGWSIQVPLQHLSANGAFSVPTLLQVSTSAQLADAFMALPPRERGACLGVEQGDGRM